MCCINKLELEPLLVCWRWKHSFFKRHTERVGKRPQIKFVTCTLNNACCSCTVNVWQRGMTGFQAVGCTDVTSMSDMHQINICLDYFQLYVQINVLSCLLWMRNQSIQKLFWMSVKSEYHSDCFPYFSIELIVVVSGKPKAGVLSSHFASVGRFPTWRRTSVRESEAGGGMRRWGRSKISSVWKASLCVSTRELEIIPFSHAPSLSLFLLLWYIM